MSEKTKAQELQELQQAQLSGKAETISANKDSNYKIASAEKDYIHVALVTRTNNPVTLRYDEAERVVAYRPEEYESMKKTNAFDGYYSQAIVHDPRKAAEVKASEKEIAANKFVKDAANGGQQTGGEGEGEGEGENATAPKNKAEWQALYATVAGEAPADSLTIAQLQEAIEAKKKAQTGE